MTVGTATSYTATANTDVVIITHGDAAGMNFSSYNGENIEYTPAQFFAWLDAYTAAPQIKLTLVACGGAMFAWRLMEHERRERRLMPFAADQTVFVKDPNPAEEDQVTLVENTAGNDVESYAHPGAAVQPAQRSAHRWRRGCEAMRWRRWRRKKSRWTLPNFCRC